MKRRDMLKTTAMTALAATLPFTLSAQEFPKLDFFVPAAPGGGWDQTSRLMEKVLKAENLIGSSMITNIGGAGGTVGLPQFIRQHSGNGEILMTAGMVMIGAIVTSKSPVDLSMVTPIARLTGEYVVIVVPAASEIQNLGELVAKLKEDPGSVSWAGGSAGGTDHTLAALIAQEVGVDPRSFSWVAFAGGGEAMASLLGNQVTAGVSGYNEFAEQIEAGNLRAIAISSPERIPGVDVPTIKEQGINVELLNWRGVFAAPDISPEEKAKLIDLMAKLNETEAWKEELESRTWTQMFLAGDEFDAYLKENITQVQETLKSLGLAG